MQDIYSIGAAGQIIGGGGGDRRLRPHHHHHHHQELKCPRCDSLNTKFCYYNNYNLSQPRHFCKNCRRYWTKGGVLRNIPVGGGCRKAKRAKTKPAPETPPQQPPPPPQQQRDDQRKSNSHSSSDSSSITATNSSVAVTNNAISSSAPGAAEAVSAQSSHSNLLNSDSGFEPGLLEQGSDCGIFSEIGTFTSLITSPTNEVLSFGFGLDQENQWQNQIPNHYHHQQKVSAGVEEITPGRSCDQTVQVELSALQSRSDGGGFGIFGPLDWQGDGYQELIDLPTAVDQTYWSQNHFTDKDHPNIYLP